MVDYSRPGKAPALRQLRDGRPRRDDRLPDEHEADTLVRRAAIDVSLGTVSTLENAIGRVAIDAVDPAARDRVVGRILALTPSPSPSPGALVHAD